MLWEGRGGDNTWVAGFDAWIGDARRPDHCPVATRSMENIVMRTKYSAALAIAAAAALGACAYPGPDTNVPSYSSQPAYPQQQSSRGSVAQGPVYAANTGVVNSIELIRGETRSGISPAGTIIGAVVGGLVGHQIGEGRGNTAATIGGAAVGGLAGNAIGQRTREAGADTYRVGVRYDNGGIQYIDVPHPGDLRTGDRVRVDNGQISRY